MINKAKATQILKYGGEEGYSQEMARRRALAKNVGLAGLKKTDPQRLIEIARSGGLARQKKYHENNPPGQSA